MIDRFADLPGAVWVVFQTGGREADVIADQAAVRCLRIGRARA